MVRETRRSRGNADIAESEQLTRCPTTRRSRPRRRQDMALMTLFVFCDRFGFLPPLFHVDETIGFCWPDRKWNRLQDQVHENMAVETFDE